jgi:hypothetical protein
LLSIALALANAQCFTRCLVEATYNATPPCHSHGNSPAKTQASGPQHDLRPTAAPMVPLSALAASTNMIALPFFPATELHPPSLAVAAIPLPLRI